MDERLPHFTRHAGGEGDLITLDPEHPGFRDDVYRARRNAIARLALSYETGTPVPTAPYSPEEHAVWRTVRDALRPLHVARVCAEIQELQTVLLLDEASIPQLGVLNPALEAAAGFRMEPVAGLVTPRTFMRYLGQRVFLSTQYIRHHSRPLYTPEPDVLHELIGHAATLVHPGIAELNRLLGRAAAVASDVEMKRLEQMYWYTLEFGLVEERGEVKAYGAGLLSSIDELSNFDHAPTLKGWDLDAISRTPYDPTRPQETLFVAPSFTRMLVDVTIWVRTGGWRSP